MIIGAGTREQLETNLTATDLSLDPTLIDLLDEASALPAEHPDWMLEFGSQNRLSASVKD